MSTIYRINNALNDCLNDFTLDFWLSGYAEISPPWNWKAVNDPFSRLYYILKGEAMVLINGKYVKLQEGNMYILPSGTTVEHSLNTYMEQLYFHICMVNLDGADVLASITDYGGLACMNCKEYLNLYNSDDVTDILKLKEYIALDCIAFLKKNNCVVSTKHYSENVRRAVEYIKRNMSANLSVKEICDNLLIPKSTLNYCFNKELGKSVGEYIDNMVLEKSRGLLTETDLSISEISDTLNFCDQFYFSRKFKEKYGEAPTVYRKRNYTLIKDRAYTYNDRAYTYNKQK